MLKLAAAAPGITLVAVFGTEMMVACTLDGWKRGVPASSGVDDRRSMMRASLGIGIVGELGIGRVALLAVHDHLGVDIAAPADLDLVAHRLGAGRLADQAGVQRLAARLHPVQHLDRAVDADRLLVAGDQERERAALQAAVGLEVVERGRDEAGDAALHVGGAAPVEHAVGDLAAERRARPRALLAHRHHVGMAGKAQVRRPVPRRA